MNMGNNTAPKNASKFGKLSSGYGIGKDQFSFHFQIFLAMPKNVQTTTQLHSFHVLARQPEKAMANHSSTLAWKILWTEEPGRLQSMGSLRVGHN